MSVMAHQRPAIALRVIILIMPKTIVDQQNRAGFQNTGQAAHEMARGKVDFAHVAHSTVAVKISSSVANGRISHYAQVARSIEELTLHQRTIAPPEFVPVSRHTALEQVWTAASDQIHRHGVEHLIGKYQSAELLRKMLQPGYPGRQMWREPFEQTLLPLSQFAADVKNEIPFCKLPSSSSSSNMSSASLPVPAPNS